MRFKILFFFFFINSAYFGQSIEFSNPDLFSICQSAAFNFTIANNENQSLENISVKLELPCGIEYVEGSINGLNEEDISDLTNPEFSLLQIPASANQEFDLMLFAPCSLQDCIDLGTTFQNKINISYNSNSQNFTSPPFVVESVLPLIKNIDKSFLTGLKNSTEKRYISIQNTRPGFLTEFTFTDTHEEGIFITSTQGENAHPDDLTFITKLDGNDFSQIGNGDEFFDFNETIIIEECIDILTCNYIDLNIVSELKLEWGCGDQVCLNEIPAQNALIRVLNFNEEGPILEFSEETISPLCSCQDSSFIQKINIKNNSDLYDAVNINITIKNLSNQVVFPEENIRLIRSGGFENLTPNSSASFFSTCFGDNFNSSFTFTVDRISKNELVTLEWDARFCTIFPCVQPSINWEYRFNYEKECAELEDISHFGIGRTASENNILLLSRLNELPFLNDGTTDTLKYTILSPLLQSESGKANVNIELPCTVGLGELSWENTGNVPEVEDIQIDSLLTTIDLVFDLPFASDSIQLCIPFIFQCFEACSEVPCIDSIITSCPIICDFEPELIDIKAQIDFDILDNCPENCLPSACSAKKHPYSCDQEVCEYEIPGYLDYDFKFYRRNTGLPDNDDDHKPDNSGSPDETKIRRDHAVTGDTLRFDFTGTVVADLPNIKFDRGLLDLSFILIDFAGISSDLIRSEIPTLLSDENGLKRVILEFSIYDKSRDEFYYCNELPRPDVNKNYLYDISPSSIAEANCLPIDFKYEDGDIITLVIDYVVNYNFESNKTEYGLLSFDLGLKALIVAEDYEFDEALTCGCPLEKMAFANYKTFISQTTDFLNVCNSRDDNTGTSKLVVLGHITDHFPFEYKPSLIGNKIQFPQLEGTSLKTIQLRNLRTNGSILINPIDSSQFAVIDYDRLISDVIEVPNAANITGFYEIDIDNFEGIEWDENVTFTMYLQYDSELCEFFGSSSYTGNLCVDFPPTISELPDSENHIEFKSGLIGKDPIVFLDIQPCNNSSLSEEIFWNLTMITDIKNDFENADVTIYKWIYPVVKNQAISDFSLVDLDTGEEYQMINGIFNIPDTLREETFALQLKGISNSCDQESITFRYGWDCEPLTDIADSNCEMFETTCTVLSPPGVLDMLVSQNLSSTQLCDTLDWIEIEIFNAGLSKIFDLRLEAYLLPGLEIVANSSQILLATNNNYVSIPDPKNTSGQIFEWDFENVDPLIFEDALPGVNASPNNSFKIRFRAISSCDLIAGAPITFTAFSLKNCDEPTGNISKISAAIEIDNLEPNYNAVIEADIQDTPACQDEIDISISFELSEASVMGDSIFLQLPSGVSYVENSCSGSLDDCVPVLSNGFLAWAFPEGVSDGTLNLSL